jgi:hypothetical protein
MRLRVVVLVLVVFAYSIAVPVVPEAHAQRRAFLRVHVVDQNAHDYENVTVEIWRVLLVDSGKTDIDGLWKSRVDGDGRVYDVRVFNGNSDAKEVQVIAADVFVEFSLQRSAPAPRLVVSGVEYSPSEATAGDAVDARIKITNAGSLDATTSALRLTELPTGISVPQNASTFNLGALNVSASVYLTVRFLVDRSARTGPCLFPYELSYATGSAYAYEYEGAFGMIVGGVPMVEIHDLTVDPSTLVRGTDGTLTLELMNSGTEEADKLTVRMYNADMLTSTIAYAGRIDRGMVVDLIFGIHVDEAEGLGVHALNVTITYADQRGHGFAESRLYEIKVVPRTSLLPPYDIALGILSIALVIVALFSLRRLAIKL